MAECSMCGATVKLSGDVVKGEIIECSDCGTELEVVDLEPAVLAEAPQEEEDWGE